MKYSFTQRRKERKESSRSAWSQGAIRQPAKTCLGQALIWKNLPLPAAAFAPLASLRDMHFAASITVSRKGVKPPRTSKSAWSRPTQYCTCKDLPAAAFAPFAPLREMHLYPHLEVANCDIQIPPLSCFPNQKSELATHGLGKFGASVTRSENR
jgi:hypothetical protein